MTAARPLASSTFDKLGVLAVAADGATRELIARALQDQDRLTGHVVQGSIDTALTQLRGGSIPNLLLLDLSSSTTPVDDVRSAIAAGGPDLKIIVIGTVNDTALFRELIRAGATDYLVKPLDPMVLASALAGATQQPEPGPSNGSRLGKLAVLVGTRGGVGTTTCAISTAWILAHEFNQRTALVDLDLHFGTVALALDIDPGRGLREALEQPSRIDSLFVDRAMVRQGTRLSVLSAEEPVEEEVSVADQAVDILLHELRQKFDWVVVDMPRALAGPTCGLLAAASHVAIVAEPTLAGLRDAIRLNAFVKESATSAQLLVVDGGAGRAQRSQVASAEFEKGLGRKLDIAVPYDPKTAAASANAGRALVDVATGSPAAKALRDLAVALAGSPPSTKRQPFWRRAKKG
jgi:pilus assembly protein CpaE